jgi:hypothetical protein
MYVFKCSIHKPVMIDLLHVHLVDGERNHNPGLKKLDNSYLLD